MDCVFVWNMDPDLVHIGPVTIRWYGLMFAMAFLLGTNILSRIFKAEGKAPESIDRLLIYMLVAIVVGARLGETFFYNPAYYLNRPLEILKVWEGGLASHGAVVGILTALFIYSRRTNDQPYIWLLDRISIIVALGASLVRIGNFFNSEIIGIPTGRALGIVFQQVDSQPRHPAQLYESASYLLLFLVLLLIYKKVDTVRRQGILAGVFLSVGFTARFFIEFVKETLVNTRSDWLLNTGQLLSIPVILLGLLLLFKGLFAPERQGAEN